MHIIYHFFKRGISKQRILSCRSQDSSGIATELSGKRNPRGSFSGNSVDKTSQRSRKQTAFNIAGAGGDDSGEYVTASGGSKGVVAGGNQNATLFAVGNNRVPALEQNGTLKFGGKGLCQPLTVSGWTIQFQCRCQSGGFAGMPNNAKVAKLGTSTIFCDKAS